MSTTTTERRRTRDGASYQHLSLEPNNVAYEDSLDPTARDDLSHLEDATVCISIDDAVERLGMGYFQYRLLVSSGLCFAADGMQITMLSFLTLVLQTEWSLSKRETAALTSILFAGALVGTLVLGPLADAIGRRPVFLIAACIISIFGILLSFLSTYLSLSAAIFCVGIGVGGLTVPFDVLAEFLPSQGRGTNLLLIEYFWTLGCLYVVAMAFVTLHIFHTWRAFVALCSLPCVVALLSGYYVVPESARWLNAKGRTHEALAILREAARRNGCDVAFVFPDHMELAPEQDDTSKFTDLFTPKWRVIILCLWGAWTGFAFGYYGAIMATTKVFAFSSASSSTEEFDYGAIFISSAAELVGTTIVIFTVERIGRIPSQVWSYSIAGISLCLLCTLADQLDESSPTSRGGLVALGFVTRVFEMAGTCVTWVSTAEILETEVRSTGHSTANAMARVGAFFSPFLVQGSTPMVQVGIVMLVVHFFTAVCTYNLPETKGRSMGAIDDESERQQDLAVFAVDDSLAQDVQSVPAASLADDQLSSEDVGAFP